MSGLKKKLSLYDFDRKPASPGAESSVRDAAPSTASASDLSFGRLDFERLAPGVYRHRQFDNNPQMGARKLAEYLPLSLSGILELALWPQPEALHPEDVLFLDTETTGLTRGAGTLPFLTGLASFENGGVMRELIYLSEPGGEEDYLDYIQDRFRRFKYLVSYNGRAFDVPLLRNRLILNRKPGLPDFLHFDLLHIFRRLFPKGSLPGYRQMDLEERVLEYVREDDLPGAEIPQIYFDYVKYGHDGGLEKVFDHNLKDLDGMVLLFLEAIRLYDRREGARGSLRSGLARILMRNRRSGEALELLRDLESEIAAPDRPRILDPEYADDRMGGLRYRDYLLLGQLQRARGDFQKAADVFERVVARYDCPYAAMALAKLLEHRLKDYPAALAQTERLIRRFAPEQSEDYTQSGKYSRSEAQAERPIGRGLYASAELEKRRARIERKLSRSEKH
ncbi:MAG: ribonuclease H-like domain-containing protein [bacterium]|nr:ribonuclease H-like domain-containing protein [bacterium]